MKRDRERRQAQQLAADQASRRLRRGRRRRCAARRGHARSPPAARWSEIAAGKGKGPKPFMTGQGVAPPTRSGSRTAATADAHDRRRPQRSRKRQSAPRRRRPRALPDFVAAAARQARSTGRRSGAGWGHEIKFDGYRLQLRVEDGKATLKTRKGLDWTDKFKAIAEAGAGSAGLPSIDGEAVRAGRARRAGLRGPAGGAVRRQDRRPDLLRLRPAVRRRRGPAALPLPSARRG